MPPFSATPPFKPVIPGSPGLPLNFIFGLLNFILSIIGVLSSPIPAIEQAINNTWSNVVMTSAFLYNGLGFLIDFVKKFLAILFGGLTHIITDILHGHLLRALQDIQALLHALHNLFAPLLAWLHKLQAIQRKYQMQSMKRVINLIQRVRSVLVVFKLLHLKWAKKLDNFLAGVEGKIISREMAIVQKTNQVIGWINLVTDPFGTLRTVSVFAPIGASLRGMLGALNAVDAATLFPGLAQVWTDVPAGTPRPMPQLPGPAHPVPQTP